MDTHRQMVHSLFSRIAGRYDAMNTVLSLNLDRHWRRKTLQTAGPKPGERWLDVCCGTGKLTIEISRLLGSEGEVAGLDFNASMLEVAKRAESRAKLMRPIHWIEADAMELPFPDAAFDGVTIGFGLRNLPDIDQGIREMRRVLKPDGRWVCLELSHPVWPIFRQGHSLFVRYIVPRIGNLGHSGESDYLWLPESLRRFPGAEELAERICEAGLSDVRFRRLSGGIAAVHVGTRS
jgi:demethylmenaquinone methyltransferase/2-methoxy-6-polyprenyl-1,4-benzoquinol methylase